MAFKDELVFLPLGGSGEIGMNMNLYGVGPADNRKWIMIDCGVTFADEKSPGIDLISPDPEYILDEIRGGTSTLLALVLTHGHEDHIGAVATLLPFLNCPIYTTAFTAGLVNRKLAEAEILSTDLVVLGMGARQKIGPFDLELVTLTHSIPEPNGVIIRTEFGTVLHTGDWKIDKTPSLGPVTDSNKLSELAKEGVIAMVCDSTNVLSPGESGSESTVRENLNAMLAEQSGRVAITTFASNVGRLVSICEAAIACDRAICLLGRSMLRMIDVARETGILPDELTFVDPKEAGFIPNDKILYLCTGSQGESRAALARIAREDHPDISLGKGDTVIFSSKIIPGNEREIYDLQNALVDQGIEVITEKDEFIHVSGHPCRDELRQMYEWVSPELSVPVHGEARHLEEHAKFALEIGIPASISPRNGDLIRLAPGPAKILDEVPTGRLMVDGDILLPDGSSPIRERRKLSYAGHVAIALVLDERCRPLTLPELSLNGIPRIGKNGEEIQELLEDTVEQALDAMPKPRRGSDEEVTRTLRKSVRDALNKVWGKRPMIDVLVLRSE